jgi:hypothetical protein
MRVSPLSLLGVLVACGRFGFGETAGPDGGTTGSGDSGFGPDAPAGTPLTSVTVFDGVAESGITVLFHDAEGALIGEAATNSEGTASGAIPAGGMITLVFGEDIARSMVTFTALQPGDAVLFGAPFDRREWLGDVAISLPGPQTGAGSYAVYNGCDLKSLPDAATVANLYADRWCSPGLMSSSLAVAFDAVGDAIAHGYVTSVAPNTDAPTPATTSAWSTLWETLQVEVRDIPAGTSSLEVFSEDLRGQIPLYFTGDSTTTITPVVTLPLARAGSPAVDGLGVGVIAYGAGGGRSGAYFASAEPPAAATKVISLAAALPWLSSLQVVADGDGRPSIRANTSGSLAGADGGTVFVTWAIGANFGEWLLVVPPGATDVRLPQLPASLADFAPQAGTTFSEYGIKFIDADFVPDYHVIRTNPTWLMNDELISLLPPTRSVWITEITFEP